MHEDNRGPSRRAELAVDASDELVDTGAQVHVLLNVLSRRDGQLNEDNLELSAQDSPLSLPSQSTPGVE